jgi:hypothetical protein
LEQRIFMSRPPLRLTLRVAGRTTANGLSPIGTPSYSARPARLGTCIRGACDQARLATVYLKGSASLEPHNVKHQRARATASRENGAISLRALRCMR